MTDIAISVIGKIAEYTVAPIGRQFGYLFCYNGNIEKLRSQDKKLEAKRMDVEQMVEVAKNNCQTISKEVELWLENERLEKVKVDTILGDTEKVGKGCLNEWCLNLKSRYWVSRKAAKKSMDLDPLIEAEWNEVAGTQQPLGILPDQTPIVGETQGDGAAAPAPDQIGSSSSGGLDSRVSIMKKIMEAVKDDKIRRIGIWGMGGVGKTTMVKDVKRMADKRMFDEVVMTTVSKEPEPKKIQEDIAELLGLELKEQNTSARADRLHCRLTQKRSNGEPKRILVILDDVWSKLNLEEVGIPYEDSDQNGCKIVLISRHKNVCDEMETNKTFFVNVLPEQEALSLFQEKNRNSLYASTDLPGIAKDIVKECGGLPIAIANIANALVSKKEATWKNVLRQLQNSALEGEYAVVYTTLEMSYNFLKTKEIKDFFLLCCLFPEDFNIPIEDLVRYGMGLRFFKNIGNLQDARNQADAHVETLKNSNLLLGGESEESVKMHDLVRDFALYMTSEGEQVFMVKFGNGSKAWPKTDTYECYTSISLQCDEMHELPVGLKLLSLKILQLECFSDRRSLQFPEEFYQGMGKLEVLVLRNMSIPSLPGSLQLLTNLRTLSLYECALGDNISMIGYLEKLEILSFAGSEMEELAGEIGKLSRLRLLDLTDCRNLRRIPPSVLPSLTHLEELYMRGTSSFLWAEEESNATNASFAELKKLTNLVCIHIQIPLKVLPIDLTLLEKLEKFNLLIGREYKYGNPFSVFQNNLGVSVDKSVGLEGIMNALCMRTENLDLQVKDLKNLPESINLLKLKRLRVKSSDKLVSIVNTMGRRDTTTIIFPILESLFLWDLSNLEDICCGLQSFVIPSSSTHQPAPFGNLRKIKLWDCNKLKNIFSLSIARGLSKLQSLQLWDCQMMEEIFCNGDDKAVGKNIEFPNLKKLILRDLPNLVGFCKAVEKVEIPQLEHLELKDLPKLTSLYHNASEPHNPSPKHPLFNQKVKLSNLEILSVSRMENLLSVFPSNIIEGNGDDKAVGKNIEFPNLKELDLRYLPNLVGFCKAVEKVELPQLERLKLEDLPKLTSVYTETDTVASEPHNASPKHPLFNQKVTLNNLEALTVSKMENLIEIWPSQFPNDSISKLRHMEVGNCGRLMSVFPSNIIQGLQNLEFLTIEDCDRLENIFSLSMERGLVQTLQSLRVDNCQMMEEIFSKDENDAKIEFPNLEKLFLSSLPNLVGFCKSVDEVELPQRKDLALHALPKLETKTSDSEHLFNLKVKLSNLEKLTVPRMENLFSVFPSNIIEGLQNLQSLRVDNCQMMEEIFSKDENDAKIEFPNLKELFLSSLPNLVGFCKSIDEVEFPQLKDLALHALPKIETKTSDSEHLFNLKVPLTNLVTLDICKMDHPTTVCPATVIQQLHNVGKLEVGECRSVQVVFDFQGLNINESRPLTQLETLIIRKLPKLTHVWKKGQHVIQGFQNLTTLKIERCDSLKHLFTPSVAKILVGLEDLKIIDCMRFEAIVAKEEGGEEKQDHEEEILFPQLTFFYLSGLPNLLAIAPKPYTLNLSSLKVLSVYGCGKGAEPLNDILQLRGF